MRRKGFTLIELLIVVAIIAILAAIAVPNFLEAQVRSKVSRVYTDQRTVTVALEAYRVDANHYPTHTDSLTDLYVLTTPVAYITSLPVDPFYVYIIQHDTSGQRGYRGQTYQYEDLVNLINIAGSWWGGNGGQTLAKLVAQSHLVLLDCYGPDGWPDDQDDLAAIYDSTNGTKSRGDIYRLVP
jgi:type II secretion system protein G